MSESAITGCCLCGVVTYRVYAALGAADHCHCSMCRRQHGAAFATYADCAPSDFAWTSGEEAVQVYEVAGGGGWAFCRHCGSTLAGTDGGRITSVTLGTVEGDPRVRAASHIFVDSKAPWFEIDDTLPQHAARELASDGDEN